MHNKISKENYKIALYNKGDNSFKIFTRKAKTFNEKIFNYFDFLMILILSILKKKIILMLAILKKKIILMLAIFKTKMI